MTIIVVCKFNKNLFIMLQKTNILFILFCFISSIISCNPDKDNYSDKHTTDDYLIVLSMDGFRWDYADRTETPNIDHIKAAGVKAEYVEPVFPSKTFPNHYSMATGLYPDNHGIIDNNFYCPDLDKSYAIWNEHAVTNGDFYYGEPIWVTAEKQNLTSAIYYWVGSEATIKGVQPTYMKEYDASVPFENRIDKVFEWLELPSEQRPRLIMFYFNEPDKSGHNYGPESEEIDNLVAYLDSLIGIILDGFEKFDDSYNINFILTSDHGMTEVSTERYVDLTDYVERDWFERRDGGNPLRLIEPKEGYSEKVYDNLKNVENISVWHREDIPERFNYGSNPRVSEMIVLADTTWSVGWGAPRGTYYTGGSHGWDHEQKDMHTIFYAIGPAFKENHKHPPFNVIDLYPLMAKILNLKPAKVDGCIDNTIEMLNIAE